MNGGSHFITFVRPFNVKKCHIIHQTRHPESGPSQFSLGPSFLIPKLVSKFEESVWQAIYSQTRDSDGKSLNFTVKSSGVRYMYLLAKICVL